MKRKVSIVLAVVAALLLVRGLTAVAVRVPAADAADAASRRSTVRDGVWIWTRADAKAFSARGPLAEKALPGVLVLSIDGGADGELRGRRGIAPSSVGAGDLAAVVRIEDAVAPRLADPPSLAAALDAKLAGLRSELRESGVHVAEVQLDFDVPVSRLAAWADVVGRLGSGSLEGVPVWVTSIPAHLADPRYGELFRDVVEGHVYQTFDTGLACGPREIATARDRLRVARLPFRVGIATFERAKDGQKTTDHVCWANATRQLWMTDGYAGAWVFPAGRAVDDAFSMVQAD
jgi:hypothetical protein